MLKTYLDFAKELFNIDSPTGYAVDAIEYIRQLVSDFGFEYEVSRKGNLKVILPGLDNSKTVATSGHVDTLGLMVRSISSNGELKLTPLGGPSIPTLDGEYCRIRSRSGKIYIGTIISTSPSVHVFKDAGSKPRDIDNIIVRLDELVSSADDVKKLGIESGDFVFIDPKFTVTDSGFIKSRFIDDKGGVCCLLTLLDLVYHKLVTLANRTIIYFVIYEEVGHGASVIDDSISEFVTIDMGCVGLDLNGDETKVSICAKDSHGPYDYELTNRLVNIAKNNSIDYIVDIFPFYGSDIGAALAAGHDFKGALIGPGVAASHGMERTHLKAIDATIKLLVAYLEGKE